MKEHTFTFSDDEFAAIAGGLIMGSGVVVGREDVFLRGVQLFSTAVLKLGHEGITSLTDKFKPLAINGMES